MKITKNPLRILVLDENQACFEMYNMIISKEVDCNFKWVTNGEEALKVLKNQAFDLLITDTIHPGIDGISLLETIKGLYPNMQRVVITAIINKENAKRALAAGAMEYLNKPFLLEETLDMIRKVKQKINANPN